MQPNIVLIQRPDGNWQKTNTRVIFSGGTSFANGLSRTPASGEGKDIISKTQPCGYYKESSSTCRMMVQIFAWFYLVYPVKSDFTQKSVQILHNQN